MVHSRLLTMPELPEVQTTVNGLNKKAKGCTIIDVWTNYESKHYIKKEEIKNPFYFTRFKEAVIGSTITRATRRGKNILIHLSNGFTILIHMKMTGHMMIGNYVFDPKKSPHGVNDPWFSKDKGPLTDPFNRFIRLVFTLETSKKIDGKNVAQKPTHLVMSDMRKFGKVTLIKTDNLETSLHLADIGPEPLDDKFTYNIFIERLKLRPHGKIKTVLMEPNIIAGIGNIYSDEILWLAGVHPEERVETLLQRSVRGGAKKLASTLQKVVLKTMYAAVKSTLLRGIDFGGDSMSDYRNIDGERGSFQGQHNAYRKTGLPCKRRGCKGTIRRKKVGGRSAHFCDVHQKLVK